MSLVYSISNLCHYACSPIFIWAFPHFGYFQEKYSFQILFWSLVGSDDFAVLHNTPFICQPKVRSEPIETSNDLKLLTVFFVFFWKSFILDVWPGFEVTSPIVYNSWGKNEETLFLMWNFTFKLTAILKCPHWNNGFLNTSHKVPHSIVKYWKISKKSTTRIFLHLGAC